MGVVIKQGIMSSTAAYIGVLIGYINAIILMPNFMAREEIGLFRTMISASMILSYFGLYGMSSTIVRFHSRYLKDNKNVAELYGFALKVILVAVVIVLICLLVFKNQFFLFFEEKAPELNQYYLVISILVVEIVIFNYLQILAKVNLDIFVANAIRDVFYKLCHIGVVLLFGFGIITFSQYIFSHLFIYFLLILSMYAGSVKRFNIKISLFSRTSVNRGELLTFASYALLAGLGSIIFLQIDQIFISKYLGLAANGVYTTAVFMAVVIELPRRYIGEISSPIISKSFAIRDFNAINQHYKKASLNLLLLGGILFLLIVINLKNIYDLMPNGEKYLNGYWVVIIIGLTRLLDMTFSLNSEIISLSKYFRANVVIVVLLCVILVALNVILIPEFQLIGAALAVFITYLMYNLIKMVFLWIKYRFNPFSIRTLWALLILGILLGFNSLIPYTVNAIIDATVRSLIIVIIFGIIVTVSGISREITGIKDFVVNQIKKWI
jgi:O-antigen/teichoic acid export membrane protein